MPAASSQHQHRYCQRARSAAVHQRGSPATPVLSSHTREVDSNNNKNVSLYFEPSQDPGISSRPSPYHHLFCSAPQEVNIPI